MEPVQKSTSKPSIAFFEIKDSDKNYLVKHLPEYHLAFSYDTLTQENANRYKDFEAISVFINSKLTSEVLKNLPKLRFVATRSTGYDHIDLEYCKKNKIKVSNVPTYGENTVAEHAMALLLAIVRRLPESMESVKTGQFSPEGLTGQDLKGKVMGVVGTGHIGMNVVKMARGFGMKVLAYDIHPDEKFASGVGFVYVDIDYLISRSDVISLHVPYCKDTHHILDRKALKKTKKGVIIINTARGGLIETDALFDALKSGHVGGAGLDVLEEEGFLKEELELLYKDTHKGANFKIALENHVMSYLPNVIITPHNAFNSKEALRRILDTTIENMVGYAKEDYKNLVSL